MGDWSKRLPLSERMAKQLAGEHAGLIDYITELESYVQANPDDKWAIGQLRYSKKRAEQLAKKLGLAENREPRPTS